MIRFLVLAPAAVLALLSIAAPVSAQTNDLHAEVIRIRSEHRANHRDFLAIQRTLNHCETPDPAEVQRVSDVATNIRLEAITLAPFVPTRDHVQMLAIRDQAGDEAALLQMWHMPEICYQPPAE